MTEKKKGSFMDVSDALEGKLMTLKWENGSQAQGVYDSYMEDESDCDVDEKCYALF